MKLTRLLAAVGIGTLVAIPASAEPMDIIFNGEQVQIEAELVNDRTMIAADSLETLGFSVKSENGVWDIKKGDRTFRYDDINKAVSGTHGEVQTDVMPIITADSAEFPLRAVAEYLGVSVGWDEYENAVVLIDLDKYYDELKAESPALYDFLALTLKEPSKGSGSSDITVDVKVPDSYGGATVFKLKVVASEEISAKLSKTNIKLEELLLSSREFDFELDDVTVDGIFDAETMTIYLKTNAVKKIYETIPEESKSEFASIAQIFSNEAWYRVSLDDYMTFMQEMTGYSGNALSEQMSEMIESIYDGVEFGDILRAAAVDAYSINDVYAFEYVESLFGTLKTAAEAKWFTVEAVNETDKKLKLDITADSIVEYTVGLSIMQGYTPTEEEIAEFKTSLNEMFGNSVITGEFYLSDGVPVKQSLVIDVNVEEVAVKLDIDSSFDTFAEVGEIAVPTEAVDLMMLIKTLMQYAEAA